MRDNKECKCIGWNFLEHNLHKLNLHDQDKSPKEMQQVVLPLGINESNSSCQY